MAMMLAIFMSSSHGRPLVAPVQAAVEHLEGARAELNGLQREARNIRNPLLRNRLEKRIDALEGLLGQANVAPPTLQGASVGRHISFDAALAKVDAARFDHEKVEVIEDLANEPWTAAEAAALAGSCRFDTHRRDALIALFPAVVDPANFGAALDILAFSAARRDVLEAVGKITIN